MLTWIICGIIAGSVLQLFVGGTWINGGRSLANQFGLTIPALKSGHIWTLFTHGFLHDSRFLFHVLGNLLALFFLGRELLPLLGSRKFVLLFAGATALGGLAWAAVHWRTGGTLVGSTAAVDALLVVFACFYPAQRLEFLLFFFVPVSLKPKHLVFALLGLDLAGLFIYELGNTPLPFGIPLASSAHLGGMLAGWLYFRYLHEARWRTNSRDADVELPRWMNKKSKAPVATPYRVNLGSPTDLRAEVDRILDKINSSGFGALTAEEKRVLDTAKDSLSRR